MKKYFKPANFQHFKEGFKLLFYPTLMPGVQTMWFNSDPPYLTLLYMSRIRAIFLSLSSLFCYFIVFSAIRLPFWVPVLVICAIALKKCKCPPLEFWQFTCIKVRSLKDVSHLHGEEYPAESHSTLLHVGVVL